MADYTTAGLLASIRRRAMLPSAASAGTTDIDLLALANEELILGLAADLMRVREEYLLTYTDVPIDGVEYRIPSRAVGQMLQRVQLRDSSGLEMDLTRLRGPQVSQYSATGLEPFGYRLRGNTLLLVPSADTSFTTLRMEYAIRPSELTATASDFKVITGIDEDLNQVDVSSASGFSTLTPLDFVSSTPGFDVLQAEVLPINLIGNTFVFASLPKGLKVGDYLCLAGKSPVPTIPLEYHQVLAQRVAITVCAALGDWVAVDRLNGELVKMEKEAGVTLVSPRTPDSPRKVLATRNALNPHGRRLLGRVW